MRLRPRVQLLPILLLLAGCAASKSVAPPRPEAPSTTPARTPTVVSEPTPLPSPSATVTPSAMLTLAEAPPFDPFAGLRMDDLATRQYGGSGIMIGEVVKVDLAFTQYAMHYDSDDLRITGLIDIPVGEGPFPVIVVNHGYLRPVDYQSGFDSWRIADWLARHGYITLMPDYRNYAGSDAGPNPFRIGFAIDVMNLIAQVDSLPQAIPQQIGVIGHSMGGEVSMWPMILSDEVDAVVLYASMSGDEARNWEHQLRHWPHQRDAMRALALIYGRPDENPEGYAAISPINYFNRIRMPVMIHHGTHDESVPYWWSEEMWHLMQEAGVNVTFWPYPGGGHTLSGQSFEVFMQRNLAFFDEYVRGNVNTP